MPNKQLPQTIELESSVEIIEGAAIEGGSSGPPRFNVVAYTGGAMNVNGWDLPVVIDLAGMKFGNSLVANLDHNRSQRVGNVTAKTIEDGRLTLSGIVSAATDYAREVVESSINGFVWQASVEAQPQVVTEIAAGKTYEANGQTFEGPIYAASKSLLKGFAFVSHGADDNTSVTIAATAEPSERKVMDPALKTWIEAMGFDADTLTATQLEGLKANYAGSQAPTPKPVNASDPFSERKAEAKRRREIREIVNRQMDLRNSNEEEIIALEKMHDHAIEAGMTPEQFRLECYEAMVPIGGRICPPRHRSKINNNVVSAAICQAGRLPDIERHFDDQTLQAAHDEFKGRIGLKQLLLLGAAENGGSRGNYSSEVDQETLRAAFARRGSIHGAFSTLEIPDVISATANKFIMRGWNSVDQTAMRIAKIQSVRNFQTITTVSLTDNVIYEKVGTGGEIKHGTLTDLTYTNKADTYARMLAITRQDIINDDLGALTDVPQKLGAGAMKKLNDIFWTEFLGLVGASFFASGNSNINTGVAEMTEAGLDATYVIFKNQTNPDGTPLGAEPAILLVPTALEGKARRLTRSEQYITGTDGGLQGSTNIWSGRFQVESSPYISNSSYTGNTAVGWWMLANPMELPVIAIAALNGRVEPVVDTAEADFNTLGVQMRGYTDIGVNDQEYRGGVYADGGAS